MLAEKVWVDMAMFLARGEDNPAGMMASQADSIARLILLDGGTIPEETTSSPEIARYGAYDCPGCSGGIQR